MHTYDWYHVVFTCSWVGIETVYMLINNWFTFELRVNNVQWHPNRRLRFQSVVIVVAVVVVVTRSHLAELKNERNGVLLSQQSLRQQENRNRATALRRKRLRWRPMTTPLLCKLFGYLLLLLFLRSAFYGFALLLRFALNSAFAFFASYECIREWERALRAALVFVDSFRRSGVWILW